MSKIAIVYWSGTGNTEAMANFVAAGAKESGAEVGIFVPENFKAEMITEFDAIAFGCSSMGDEVLEETEFEPLFMSCEDKLKDKKIALFGSYGWGDGEWMRDWEERCKGLGAALACDYVICQEMPDGEAETNCKALGKALV
jgi:flavodoxin, short chain